MFPSSSRVKLNRVALKNVIGLELVPRRRRASEEPQLGSQPVEVTACQTALADPMGAEEKPEQSRVGTHTARKTNNVGSFKGAGSKHEGPYTRGRHRQSLPNTRSKRRSDGLRLGVTWCFCAASDSVSKRTQVRPGARVSCQIKFSNTCKRPESLHLKSTRVCASSARRVNVKRGAHVARRRVSREDEGKVKAGWGCRSAAAAAAAANTGPTGTRLAPTGPSSKRANTEDCWTGMVERNVGEDPGPGSRLIEAEIPSDKRIKLGQSVEEGVLPSTPDLESEKTDSSDKGKTCFWESDVSQSRSELVGGCSSSDKEPLGESSPTNTEAAQMSPEQFCQSDEMEGDETESIICQRVRPYYTQVLFSCARTCMPWPFTNNGCSLRTAHAGPTARSARPIESFENTHLTINHHGTPSSQTDDAIPNAPTGPSPDQASHEKNKEKEEHGEGVLVERNGKRRDDTSSYSSDNTSMEPHLTEAKESLASPSHFVKEPDTEAASSLAGNTPQSASSMSTPSPSPWETSSTSSFLPAKYKNVASHPNCIVKYAEKPLFCCEETRTSPSSSASPQNSDSSQSWESSLLLPQERQQSDEEFLTDPPNLEPYYDTSPVHHDLVNIGSPQSILAEKRERVMLPPVLSPVSSPRWRSQTHSQGCSCEEEEEINKGACKHKMLPRCPMPHFVNRSNETSNGCPEDGFEELEGMATTFKPPTPLQVNEKESLDYCNGDEEQGNSDPEIKAPLTLGALTGLCSSPGSDEDDGGTFVDEPRSAQAEGCERDRTKAKASDGTQQGVLDEYAAYEQDILLVDMIQEDSELFENLPQEALLKLGPTRVTKAPTMPLQWIDKPSPEFQQRLTAVYIAPCCDSPDATEERRPWRPPCRNCSPKALRCTITENRIQEVSELDEPDANNNHVEESLDRNEPIRAVNSLHNPIPPPMNVKNGLWITNMANMSEFRRQKSNAYCRQYFSESLSCMFKMCRFQHVPLEGDEKFCVETVTRFIKNPMCLQKAGAVFTGYYHNNPPGVYFSKPVLLTLLWALLKAGMVSDVFSVLVASLAYKIVPGHEFMLALFNFVRERGLVGPELMQLTFKMASAGLVLSLDCLDWVKNTPQVQQTSCPNSASGTAPEDLNLAHAVVEVELCSKQENWRHMGEVLRSVCRSSQHPSRVERISGRIAIALLSESKDKLSLPFAAFAETVCQNEVEDSLVRSFLGRIGVSLMLRYHKTHQWAKGRRVVEVLSLSKVNYSMMKGLFGNEDHASRCYLITVATELSLLSGSVEGALNTLRENSWFLSSCSWACDAVDLESRTRVLVRLAEKTSHRNTLEVLSNLPGLKEPNELVNTSRYCPLFNSHLQVCVDRQMLSVASDTVDFMLAKNLAVDHTMLQILLHKMGKQNIWMRAREVFRHSLSVGYYPGVAAPHGFMALIVPCRLGEVELALAFEMFVSVNASVILNLPETTSSSLSITLKRTQSCEREYLAAGSRLLSAACIPQPKLTLHCKAVNSSREQVFALDVPSARCWLRHNHLWAHEVWTHN